MSGWRGGRGSKTVCNFSKNSSDLVARPFPKDSDDDYVKEHCRRVARECAQPHLQEQIRRWQMQNLAAPGEAGTWVLVWTLSSSCLWLRGLSKGWEKLRKMRHIACWQCRFLRWHALSRTWFGNSTGWVQTSQWTSNWKYHLEKEVQGKGVKYFHTIFFWTRLFFAKLR